MKSQGNIVALLVSVVICCMLAIGCENYIKNKESTLENEFLNEITQVSQSVNQVFHKDGNEKYIEQVLAGAHEKKLNIGYGGTFDYILVKESFPQEIYNSIIELVDKNKKIYPNSLNGGWIYIHFRDDMTISIEVDDDKGNVVSCKYVADVYLK